MSLQRHRREPIYIHPEAGPTWKRSNAQRSIFLSSVPHCLCSQQQNPSSAAAATGLGANATCRGRCSCRMSSWRRCSSACCRTSPRALLIDGNISSKIRDSYLIEIMDVLMLTVLATNNKLLMFGW
ncbi:hypothetical protein PVAP13_2NG097300 [Panicum virgatum]|uniref:Uncharacterized protein n=1 Tax=Panicum virgatum TaxID=38727 RepID=A0A8T0VDJ6_PANVG|nr:hypothetical protein PVAP13_2NG097300 [Panicum virgatum]